MIINTKAIILEVEKMTPSFVQVCTFAIENGIQAYKNRSTLMREAAEILLNISVNSIFEMHANILL